MRDSLVEVSAALYSVSQEMKDQLSDENIDRLRQLGWTISKDREKWYGFHGTMLLSEVAKTAEEFPILGDLKISKVRGLHYDNDIVNAIACQNVPHVDQVTKGASPIQISVFNEALLSMRTIDYIEDACTIHVRECMQRGWRILAICPANDSRRPTYILGHANMDERL